MENLEFKKIDVGGLWFVAILDNRIQVRVKVWSSGNFEVFANPKNKIYVELCSKVGRDNLAKYIIDNAK